MMFETRPDASTSRAMDHAHAARGQALRTGLRWLFGRR
ncbi:hypothetical protein ROA7023_00546 [Roseisalinus antarcticus]|uniref:Uncharacterized protein n=1 Tax=Roseisalinus antarcticus TaxID=254357 RepID=A0A1Y5RMY3_9RHOB|nr:hypothetical protein ROA7023_00546 [Roseisalinus antarcticus]